MTEPRRLLSGEGDEVELALLRSAHLDAPSRDAMRRAMVAVGIGGGVAGAAGIAAASAAAKASMPPTAAAASGQSGLALLVKWIGIAAVGGLATWGVVDQLSPEAPTLALAAPTPDGAAPGSFAFDKATTPSMADPPVAGTDPAHEPPANEAPANARSPEDDSPRSVRPLPRKPTSTLADEVAALDQARRAMSDDPEAALAAVERYQEGFKGGVLAEEAAMLRVESLARAGKKDEARAAAAAFLARYPKSAHAARVRALMQGEP